MVLLVPDNCVKSEKAATVAAAAVAKHSMRRPRDENPSQVLFIDCTSSKRTCGRTRQKGYDHLPGSSIGPSCHSPHHPTSSSKKNRTRKLTAFPREAEMSVTRDTVIPCLEGKCWWEKRLL